jgi:hypothetical protein
MGSLVGQRFGRLAVISASDRPRHWVCACDCGGSRTADETNLRAGRTMSCGCLWRERVTSHGAAGTATYRSWKSMISRCTKPNDPGFDRYGGAGVKVAPEWVEFAGFIADMGPRPAGTTIDRIDPFGDYTKSNCRWATAVQQARNHRKPAPLIDTPLGPMRVCEAAERSGLPVNLIRARIRLKWAPSRLLDPVDLTRSHPKEIQA